jgi:hypothetical protein
MIHAYIINNEDINIFINFNNKLKYIFFYIVTNLNNSSIMKILI